MTVIFLANATDPIAKASYEVALNTHRRRDPLESRFFSTLFSKHWGIKTAGITRAERKLELPRKASTLGDLGFPIQRMTKSNRRTTQLNTWDIHSIQWSRPYCQPVFHSRGFLRKWVIWPKYLTLHNVCYLTTHNYSI